MRREWKPGDVVRLVGHGMDTTAIVTAGGSFAWQDRRGGGPHPVSLCHPSWGGEVRPLVVIDPEDREAVERLLRLQTATFAGCPDTVTVTPGQITHMAHALREFANPTPPRCSAHVSIAGADFQCVEPPGHGGGHRNPDAEAVWGDGS